MLRNLFVGVSMLLAMTLSAQSEKENCPDRIWMQSNAWNNGWNVSAHPSINAKEFHEQYIKNKEVWDAMFSYLSTVDLDTLSIGRIDIVPGRCYIK